MCVCGGVESCSSTRRSGWWPTRTRGRTGCCGSCGTWRWAGAGPWSAPCPSSPATRPAAPGWPARACCSRAATPTCWSAPAPARAHTRAALAASLPPAAAGARPDLALTQQQPGPGAGRRCGRAARTESAGPGPPALRHDAARGVACRASVQAVPARVALRQRGGLPRRASPGETSPAVLGAPRGHRRRPTGLAPAVHRLRRRRRDHSCVAAGVAGARPWRGRRRL